jgi:nicotinamidase-related amidase
VLEKTGRKTIIVTGVETHVCVYQTARDLMGNGYKAHILKDATGSRAEANYLNGLQLMRETGAVISDTETVLFDMLKTSASPEFKQISALVK